MDRVLTTSRINKTQRETHSEIERKRRERMKRDTEFLRRQIADPQCKDKLSIYQAGAERLIQYTDKLGKREYIINDAEYSRIIMNSFDGFGIHIRCSDGEILEVTGKLDTALDLQPIDLIGTTIQALADPGASTQQLIHDVFNCTDFQWDVFNGLISRNFVLALRCGKNIPDRYCIYGSDGRKYRFVEFCGDLSRQAENSNTDVTTVRFRGLCRTLDPVCGTVADSPGTSNGSAHFTLRLNSSGFHIIEVVGAFKELLGCSADYLLRKQLHNLCTAADYDMVDRLLNEVQLHSPVNGSLHLIHAETSQPIRFDVRLSAIRLGSHFHCVICRMSLPASDQHDGDEHPRHDAAFHPTPSSSDQDTHHNSFTQPTRDAAPFKDEHFSNQLQPIDFDSYNKAPQHPQSSPLTAPDIYNEPIGDMALSREGTSLNQPIDQSLNPTSVLFQDQADEWFKAVDTSSFQSLLNSDFVPTSDLY